MQTIALLTRNIEEELREIGLEPGECRAETEAIVWHFTKLSLAERFRDPERVVAEVIVGQIYEVLARRKQREPLQYCLGETQFYGLLFKIGPGVLIPRSDTETLVQAVLEHLSSGEASLQCPVAESELPESAEASLQSPSAKSERLERAEASLQQSPSVKSERLRSTEASLQSPSAESECPRSAEASLQSPSVKSERPGSAEASLQSPSVESERPGSAEASLQSPSVESERPGSAGFQPASRCHSILSAASTTAHYVGEIGIGSGIISIALLNAIPLLRISACDISAEAIAITRINAESHAVLDRLELHHCDWRDWLKQLRQPMQIIVANPPYIPKSQKETLEPEVSLWEPAEALFGGDDDGLGFYRDLARLAPPTLAQNARVFLEIGFGQQKEVEDIFRQYNWRPASVHFDLNGIARVLSLVPKIAPFEISEKLLK